MTISLRLSEEDTLLIKKYAEINKLSVSDLIRQTVMERIETEYDLEMFGKAVAEYKNNLKKLDRHTAALILGWVRKNLENCENPRQHGKALTADKSGQWRYRVGDYRLLALIEDDKIRILVLNVGHRREVYN